MASPLSTDLRQRVVAAVSSGASCRQAASRFGVSAASASRWAARLRQDGHVAPRPLGGDYGSHRVEARAGLILATCRRKPTIFLRELRDHLAGRGVQTSTSGLSSFFARHGISRLATTLFEGATNGERFRGYVADTLVAVLTPGDTVFLDNLCVHKVAGVREAVQAAGARLLFLPPCSPDFNPIEQALAKPNALLRSAAARTVTDLHQAIQQAFSRFTPQECRNYVTAAGYEDNTAVAT